MVFPCPCIALLRRALFPLLSSTQKLLVECCGCIVHVKGRNLCKFSLKKKLVILTHAQLDDVRSHNNRPFLRKGKGISLTRNGIASHPVALGATTKCIAVNGEVDTHVLPQCLAHSLYRIIILFKRSPSYIVSGSERCASCENRPMQRRGRSQGKS